MRFHGLKQSAFLCALALSACATQPDQDVVALPKRLDIDAPVDIDVMLKAAQKQRMNRDFESATRTLSQLVLALPDDPRVLSEYGKVLLDKGATSDALAFLQRSLELQSDASTYSAQGVAYAQSEDYPHAETAFRNALSLKPDDPAILNNFAMAQLQAGKLDEAEVLLLQASTAGSDHPRVAQNLALVRKLRLSAPAQAQPQTQTQMTVASPVAPAEPVVAVAPPPPIVEAHLPAPAPAAPVQPVAASSPAPQNAAPPPKAVATPPKATQAPANIVTPAAAPAQTAVAPERPQAPRVTVPRGGVTFVQVGAFSSADSAGRAVGKLSALGATSTEAERDGVVFHRVRIGPLKDSDNASAILARVQALGYPDARLIADAAPTAASTSAAPKAPAAKPIATPTAIAPKTAPPAGAPALRLGSVQE